MLGATGLLVADIMLITQRYLEYPVIVAITMKQEAQLDFPAVTVCNMNRYNDPNGPAMMEQQGQEHTGSDVSTAIPGDHILRRRKRDICRLFIV